MDTTQDMNLMEGFTSARRLLTKLQYEAACSNRFAYTKLCRVDEYLASQQEELGKRMFLPADIGQDNGPMCGSLTEAA
jgi:hypothetical protein